MKNVIITILTMLVLGLCGFLVYDKVIDKSDSSSDVNSEDTISQTEVEEYVGVAFSQTLTTDWPTEEIENYAEPDTITKKVVIPKILIQTNITKNINDKIYNDYIDYINMFNDSYEFNFSEKVTDINITYDYKVYENILYIIVMVSDNNYNGGGHINYMSYYYDIENDKELTVTEICSKYNIDLINSFDESADKIFAVMPTYLDKFDVYYTQDSSCPSYGCKGMYSTFNQIKK